MSMIVQSRYQAPNLRRVGIQTIDEILFARPTDNTKQGVQVAAGFPHVDVGDALGRITSSGLYRRIPAILNLGARAIGDTFFVATDYRGNLIESPFNVGEAVSIDTAGQQEVVNVTGFDNITGQVKVTAFTKTHASLVVAGLNVLDGSEKIVGFAAHPAQPASYDATKPNANNLLDVDYAIDCLLDGWFYKSKLRGVSTIAKAQTDTGAFIDLSPAFDAIRLR